MTNTSYNHPNLLKGYRKVTGIYRHNVPIDWHIMSKELKQSIQEDSRKTQSETNIKLDSLAEKIHRIVNTLFPQEQLNKSLSTIQQEESEIPYWNEPDEVWAKIRGPLLLDIALVYYGLPAPAFRTYSGSFEVYWHPVLEEE